MFEKPQDMDQETWDRLHKPDAERASWIIKCVEAGHYHGDSADAAQERLDTEGDEE